MDSRYAVLQTAVYERFSKQTSWHVLSKDHSVSVGLLRRTFTSWHRRYPASQPVHPTDIHLQLTPKGRPTALTADEENTIAELILYYADNNTPLTRQGIRDLVQDYVSLLPPAQQEKVGFNNNRPSNNWVTAFLRRNDLQVQHVQLMDDKRVKAVTPENLTEHIARIEAALIRYNIKKPRHIFNTDQSGSSFDKMKGRSLRKGVGAVGARLIQNALSTKGALDRVTVMSVGAADGTVYKPAIIFPGKLTHFRRVRGEVQSLHSVLPPCYLFHRNPPGADTETVFQWARGFVEKTKTLRKNGQRLLLLLDGYGAHVQYQTLKLLKENSIIVIALPAHTSHITQPLDVSVFSSYKSHPQHELHKAARQKLKLNAFDVGQCISNAYSNSHTATNLRSGFHKTGIWDQELLKPNLAPLQKYMVETNGKRVSPVTVKELMECFRRGHRTLLRDALVEEEGHVRINTTAGAHLTSDAVLAAVKQRAVARHAKQRAAEARQLAVAYKEPKADIMRLIQLAPQGDVRRHRLAKSRKARREARRARARVGKLMGVLGGEVNAHGCSSV